MRGTDALALSPFGRLGGTRVDSHQREHRERCPQIHEGCCGMKRLEIFTVACGALALPLRGAGTLVSVA
jgi:hypothetical protein